MKLAKKDIQKTQRIQGGGKALFLDTESTVWSGWWMREAGLSRPAKYRKMHQKAKSRPIWADLAFLTSRSMSLLHWRPHGGWRSIFTGEWVQYPSQISLRNFDIGLNWQNIEPIVPVAHFSPPKALEA